MNIILLIIILVYQIVTVILDIRDMKKYQAIQITSQHKVKFYREAIIFGWIPVCIVVIFIAISALSFSDIGFRIITLSENLLLNIVAGIVSLFIIIALCYQIIMYFISVSYRKQVAEELHKKEQHTNYDKVMSHILIPASKLEKTWFLFVSLTAGICEEIIWRGCLIFLLSGIFPSISIIGVGLISCLLFGLAHIYQGIHGIIKTGIIAVLFVLIYFATDSLIPGMILHFFFDYSSAFLVKDNK